jgi:transcriptional regulator with XRE-family HTH domain
MFVELKVDKVMRAGFRAARIRDNMTLKALAAAANVRESLLLRFEHGQQNVRVEELEGLKNAHKLLNLDCPKTGEPFEYRGGGTLPGGTMGPRKRALKGDAKPVTTKPTPPPAAQQPGRLHIPTIILGSNEVDKKVRQMLLLMDLEKQGILDPNAAKESTYALLKQLNLERL